ncbi:unnamed protein product [Miscanthus lutarioriparius]|uniref:F-box/LRR-repeat protein 15/At3g58940/PEG3-like LRR domain-containing protein n=1 Tax=Miscanthus lutarioriparius TaxID=422564 RepID=A0A811NMV9_9POAL|nr:unnamed protein product [Miscanthus lutarioriparius]
MVGRRRGAPPPGPRRLTRSQSRVDRISALPDDLLLQVLTRLRCARTAARTALLARRWRRVWPGLLEVSFRGLAPDAIHAALARVTRTSLEAIDIHVSRGTGHRALDAGSITSLLHAAADRSPVKLALTIPVDLPHFRVTTWIELPRFDFATSIELDVQDVRFALSAATEFPKLETLSLSGCIMDLATLVPRCPLLRALSVTRTPDEVDTITVHSASLHELVVSTFRSTSTIDIVAPALRKLTLALDRGIDNSLSVVAPIVEEVTWRCLYYSMYVGIGKMWRVGSINTPYPSQRDFAEELEKIPVTTFSALELKIATRSHVLGPLLLNLLRICTAVQRLDMVLVDTPVQVTDSCDKWCPCQENNRKWRTKTTISLANLTEVQIKGFKGGDDEIDFLKMLSRCAPMLQTMTLKLSDEVTNDWYNIFIDTVQEYPYVNSSVCIG